MALYYLCESHIPRPRSALKAAAYRAGEYLEHNGKRYDYTNRQDIVHSEIILPDRAPPDFSDRQTLWATAENAEDNSTRRKTARVAHEIIIAFPRELTFETSIIMARELIYKCFVSKGMCVDFNVHRGDRKDMGHVEADHKDILPHNPHGHIMLSTRHVGTDGFSKHKAREWESWGNPTLLVSWREEWANIQNKMFEQKGLEVRVSHERSVEREIDHGECSHDR